MGWVKIDNIVGRKVLEFMTNEVSLSGVHLELQRNEEV